jgi:hypothetical protein
MTNLFPPSPFRAWQPHDDHATNDLEVLIDVSDNGRAFATRHPVAAATSSRTRKPSGRAEF